jgi:hypothetical protein
MSIQVLELLDKVKKERERKERGEIQPNESTTSFTDDVGAEDDFEDEEEDEVVRAQVKRKSKVKFSASTTSRKLVEEEDDINWENDEFKDLNFGEDEPLMILDQVTGSKLNFNMC